MSGFTGLDPYIAEHNINSFSSSCAGIQDQLYYAMYFLFDELRFSWCSPAAVEFGNKFVTKFQKLYDEFAINANKITRGAQIAYNIAARVQRLPEIRIDEVISGGGYSLSNPLKEVNPEGIVGMNHQLVEVSIDDFNAKMKRIVDEIESLPRAIALYDTEDGQQKAYSNSISQFSGIFKLFINEFMNSLRQKALEEEENILLAKKQAADTLNA